MKIVLHLQLTVFISMIWLSTNTIYAQTDTLDYYKIVDSIVLKNSSFENKIYAKTLFIDEDSIDVYTPKSWFMYQPNGGNPPYVCSKDSSLWNIEHEANHKDHFMYLVTRDDQTYHSIGQRLKTKLSPNKTYAVHLYISTSKTFKSPTRKKNNSVKLFNRETCLSLGKYFNSCYHFYAISPIIDHEDWKRYTMVFTPQVETEYFRIAAIYRRMQFIPTNGNILVDNISPIYEIEYIGKD